MSELARLLGAVREIAEDGPPFALVGGFAVSVRTEPRFTRDVDVAVAVGSDTEAEAITQRLAGGGFRITAVIEHETTGRLATARLRDSTGGMVDLLFASSGIEPEIAVRAERLEVVPAVVFPVARTGHLIALKLLSVSDERPTDGADLRALVSVADPDDLAEAATAVHLIAERGYDRGRDLVAALAALRS